MKRVVVLNLDPEIERVAAEIREHHPVEVTVAHSAREAEGELDKGDVALVVVDLETPHHSSEKLLAWMEKRGNETPVVIGVQAGDSSMLLGKFPDVVKIFEPKPMSVGELEEIVTLYAE